MGRLLLRQRNKTTSFAAAPPPPPSQAQSGTSRLAVINLLIVNFSNSQIEVPFGWKINSSPLAIPAWKRQPADRLETVNKTIVTEKPNRYRVSTKFTMISVFVLVGFFSIAFNFIRDLRNATLNSNSIAGLILGSIALAGLLYFIRTRKQIDYDDIKQVLYVVDKQKQTEFEIPVESIDKILISAAGFGRTYHSYVIVYKDFHHQIQKIRVFPIPFDNSIDTIITDTKLKNPNLVTRTWSIGWNEFID